MLSEALAALFAISLAIAGVAGVVQLSSAASQGQSQAAHRIAASADASMVLEQAVRLNAAPPAAVAGWAAPVRRLSQRQAFSCDRGGADACELAVETDHRGEVLRLYRDGQAIAEAGIQEPGARILSFAPAHDQRQVSAGFGLVDGSSPGRLIAFERQRRQAPVGCLYDPASYICLSEGR